MPYYVSSAPASAPILASDIRDSHLHVDDSTEETYINSLIAAVTDYYERQYDKAIVEQTITETFDDWGGMCLELSVSPVIAITSLGYKDSDGADAELSEDTDFYVTKSTIGARIVLKSGSNYSLEDRPDAITVVYTAGYATLPGNVRHAILEKVARLYYMREENTEMALQSVFTSANMFFHPERKMVV